MIAGAIILTFFVSIALKQKTVSETQLSADFFKQFELAVSGITAMQDKQLLFQIPSMDLRYDCTTDCYCGAYAGTRAKPVSGKIFELDNRITFSPGRLKGNYLLTWSLSWEYPYRITNFFIMTSPEVKYLIEDTPRGREIYENLPPKTMIINFGEPPQRAIDKQLFNNTPTTPLSSLNVAGNYKVKFIFTKTESDPSKYDITALKSLPNADVTAIKLIPKSAQSPEQVIFYKKNSSATLKESGKTYILGDASRFGAVFAEDFNSYSCMMNKASRILSGVSDVLATKNDLYLEISSNPTYSQKDCGIHYGSSPYRSLSASASTVDFFKVSSAEDIRGMDKNILSIAYQNEQALQSSCPQIY